MEEWQQKLNDYGEYLEEIRRKIFLLVVAFLALFVIGFFLTGRILALIIAFLKIDQASIVTTSPFQLIDLAMNVGILVALFFSLPLALYFLYDFLRDSLRRSEKRLFFILLPAGALLFAVGFAYGFLVLYYCLSMIANINIGLGVANFWDINKFLFQIVITSALLGLTFEFPIALIFLVKLGVISVDFLRQKRRHAYLAIFIFVSLLPPTDGLSLIVMALPLLLIYEITIVVSSFSRRRSLALLTNK